MPGIQPDEVKAALERLTPERRAALRRRCLRIAHEGDLSIGHTPIPVSPFPLILSRRVVERAFGGIERFQRALLQLERHALSPEGASLRQRLLASLTPGGRRLVEQCTHESDYSLERRLRRYDGYIDPRTGDYSIIEVNQAAPLALHYHDTAQRILARLLTELGIGYEPNLLAPRVTEWLVDEFQQREPGRLPEAVALPIEHGYPPKFTDLPRFARACERYAEQRYGERIPFIVCFPHQVKLKRGRITARGRPAGMIWRNTVYLDYYRERGFDIRDYEKICASPDRHLIVNSTRSWLTRTKEAFSILWDDAACKEVGLTNAEREAVRAVVPPSFNLARNPQARTRIAKERTAWVSKPADSGFGKGIEFGETLSADAWRETVSQRAVDGFTFQRRVTPPATELCTLEPDGRLARRALEFDFCPYRVNGWLTGAALIRANAHTPAAPSRLMNLTTGGQLVPLLIT